MAKILIFSFRAGGGHVVAAQAVKEYLQNEHDVKIVFFEEVFKSIDPVALLTFKRFFTTDFYNYFIKKKSNFILNTLAYLNYLSYPLLGRMYKNLIDRCLSNSQPDIIVSVAPLLNGAIGHCAQKQDIPFIMVPTDLNLMWFSCYLPFLNSKNIFTIPFDLPELWGQIFNQQMNKEFVQVTGFPLRKSFCRDKDQQTIKQDFNVVDGKPVILLLMGSQGSSATFNYLKQLSTFDEPIHVLVCLGKNEELRSSLEQLSLAKGVTVSIISYTSRIPDLMVISDVCILKPGTVSVCEALYMNLPILCDATSMSLDWEKFNLDFIRQHEFGDVVKNYSEVNSLLKKWFSDPSYVSTLKENISLLNKPNFGISIKNLVATLLKEKT